MDVKTNKKIKILFSKKLDKIIKKKIFSLEIIINLRF